jgi:predicted NACHT family NTPase
MNMKIDFIHPANNRNIILFIHGFTGGEGTWNRMNMPSFPEMLRDEKEISENFDIAIINYYTRLASFEKIKTFYNGIRRALRLSSSITYKNVGIKELSASLKSIIDQCCNKYKNIIIVAHSMGGIVTKSYLLDELVSGSERVKIFFSLAVPHNGVEWATVGKMLYKGNEQLLDLSNTSTVLNDINHRWIQLYIGIPHTVYFYGHADRIVPSTSAISMQHGDKEIVACEDDHYTISKPENRESLIYLTVKNKLITFIEERKESKEQTTLRENATYGSYFDSPELEASIIETTSPIPRLASPLTYPMVKGHIPRRVIQIDKYNAISWLINNEDLKEPLDVLKESKHVVLLGGAGTGKSIEMKYIASICSQDSSPFVPILIKLNKFVPRSLNEIISEFWSEWNLVPDNELLLILDGLDEVESHYKKDAIKYIELFVEQHPDVNIIVSCRKNFYQSENEHFSGTLHGFNTFLIYELNQHDIDSYIASVLGTVKSQEFNIAIRQSNLRSLINIPFYLVRIIDMYLKFGSLPDNKASLYQDLITQGLHNDFEHFKNAIDLSKEQQRLMLALETVALSMEDLGRNYLTDEEFILLTNEETKELLAHCTLWKRSEESNGVRWQFEHNNFQEFLAAKILSRQDIEVIKDFLSFPPEHKKVIPSWVNTLSFLVSILDSQDARFIELLKWLNEDDPEMVIHFEADRVDESLRTQMFQHIFSYYEEKQIWINRDKFDFETLANFGKTDDNVEYLVNKISQGHYTSRVNALSLLGFMRVPISKRVVLGDKLVEIAINGEEHSVVRGAALSMLTKCKFRSPELVERIVSALRISSDDTVRTYLYQYLVDSDAVEDSIEVFLEGIQYVGIDINSTESRLINEKIELERGLEKAQSPVSVSKILHFFDGNIDEIDHFFLKDQVGIIGNNAALAYENDSSIFNSALALFKSLQIKYWLKEAKDFSIFFDKSQTRQRAVEVLFQQRNTDEDNLGAIGLLIDAESINFISQQYLEHELSNDDIWKIQREISSVELHIAFNNRINEVSNNKFVLPPRRDYEQERRDRLNRDINLLFDKEAFLQQVQIIYETEGKESFTQDEIIKARVRRDEYEYSKFVIDQIYRIAETGAASYEKVIEVIESWDWDFFSISKLYEIMSSSAEVTLINAQVQWISDWCMKNVGSFDFKAACRRSPNGGVTTSTIAIIFWYFQRKYNLKYPQDVLLDMISFDWIEGSQLLGIKYLEQYLDIETMSERVWGNLQNGIDVDDILENHIDFCKRHSINDVLPYALQTICDSAGSSTTRTTALEAYMELSKNKDLLISNLQNINDSFIWDVVKELFDKGMGLECEPYLMSILSGSQSEEEQLQSIRFLIKLQNLEALKFYVDWVDREVKGKKLIDETMPLHALKVIEALPLIINLLSLSYDDGFKQNEFERVDTEIRNAITNIALQSTENFKVVQTAIESFIRDNSHLKFINFLHVFIEDLESKHYVTLQSGRDIYEVIQRLHSIGLKP